MPAKRTPIRRELRTPKFSDEVLRLFCHLETFRDQDCREFKEGSKTLAGLLHLGDAWLCSSVDVNTKELEHPYPDDSYPAAQDWLRVRAVRNQLLAAAAALNGRHQNGQSTDDRRSTISNIPPDRSSHDAPGSTPIVAAAAANGSEQ